MAKLKIYLFRHGETNYNKNKIFTGWKESKLTKRGINDAKKIAEKLKKKQIDVAFQTQLSRSKETLKYVLKYHHETRELITANRMIERSYGDLEGTSHKDFIDKIGKKILRLDVEGDIYHDLDEKDRKKFMKLLGKEEFNAIHRGWNNPPPNGESFAIVEKRVKIFIKELTSFMKKEKVNVAISAHGNSIRLFRKIMEHTSIKETCSWNIPYDKVFVYTINV